MTFWDQGDSKDPFGYIKTKKFKIDGIHFSGFFTFWVILAHSVASNPLFIIPDIFCIFQTNFAMATLGLKEFYHFLQT
jgi:hypothetical protein